MNGIINLMALYHLDTNILVDITLHKHTMSFMAQLATPHTTLATSLICISEFLVGANSQESRVLRKLIESGEIETVGFDSFKEAQVTADIRRKTGLKLPDAIILSTAIQHKAHLLTNDKILLEKAKQYVPVTNPFDYE